jgi:alginate O-acetyltransferase complex protein AlgI
LLLDAVTRIGCMLAIALLMPNTLQMLAAYEPAIGVKPEKTPPRVVRILAWKPNRAWAVGLAGVALAGMLSLGQLSEFLYWQF